MDIQEHYDRLGIAIGTELPKVKAAYRAKLREFPAHSHPKEFKDIRASYEAVQAHIKNPTTSQEDFFKLEPMDIELDKAAIAQLKQRATKTLEVSLKDLIKLTF
ncbi:MAG: molecular chaperone DnaJ [Cyanobacteria bacterium P01_F01_bin.150]